MVHKWEENNIMTNPKIDKYGNKIWLNSKGEYHRENGPAIEEHYGTKSWWQNGLEHREDGPAVEFANDKKLWFINGKRIV
jgi:hypothetical protein